MIKRKSKTFNINDPRLNNIQDINKLEQFVTNNGGSYSDFISCILLKQNVLDVKITELDGFTLIVPKPGVLVVRNKSGSIRKLDVYTLRLVLTSLNYDHIWNEIEQSVLNNTKKI